MSAPTPAQIRRWRSYLADEQAEADVYRHLAASRSGGERDILLALADAEDRHAAHWKALLPPDQAQPAGRSTASRTVAFLARRFGFVFALAMAGRREAKSSYAADPDVPASMVADEKIHAEVLRGLAARGRARLSANFRAAVFGANDGLVSNLSLVLGVGASGVSAKIILITDIAGLLAGALSMAAGEFISVRSQIELLEAAAPDPAAMQAVAALDVNANELALVYRSHGLDEATAQAKAESVIAGMTSFSEGTTHPGTETVGTAMGAAGFSFLCFASGAVIPVLPYAFGMTGLGAVLVAAGAVGLTLLATGASVALLSGTSPIRQSLRQLGIGYGAAAVTYGIGSLFGVSA